MSRSNSPPSLQILATININCTATSEAKKRNPSKFRAMSILFSIVAGLCWLLVEVTCQNGLSERDKMVILAAHNRLRGTVNNPPAANMSEMVWNEELARKAQAYAGRCRWEHSTSEYRATDDYSWVGENLAATTGAADYAGLVQNWYDEEKDYNYYTGTCSAVCGHYTQVVWAKSTDLGCGVRRCESLSRLPGSALMLVCQYGPGGNFNNEKPYVSGVPCSACPSGRICKDNLCSANDPTSKPATIPSSSPSTAPATPSTSSSKATPKATPPASSPKVTPPTSSPPTTPESEMMQRILFMMRMQSIRTQNQLNLLRLMGINLG